MASCPSEQRSAAAGVIIAGAVYAVTVPVCCGNAIVAEKKSESKMKTWWVRYMVLDILVYRIECWN
jgi:hypothetical protein